MYLKTNQFHVAQFAYLTERMKAISEGETTLLDNSILMCARACSTATCTAPTSCRSCSPARAAASLKTGRILDYLDKGDANRKACSLYLSLMDRMGVKLDRFGDATTRLEEL